MTDSFGMETSKVAPDAKLFRNVHLRNCVIGGGALWEMNPIYPMW